MVWNVFWFFTLYWLAPFRGWALLDCGFFPLFSPFFAHFVILLSSLPYHSAILAVMLFNSCLLGLFLACCVFFTQLVKITQHDHWIYIHATLGFLDPLHFLWAPLAHIFLLGHPWPICFPWASSAHFLILHSYGLLLTLLGFFGPITLSFILGAHELSINPLLSYFITSGLLWPILTFLHHIMPIGLLLLSLGSSRPICFAQGPFIYFMGLWTIIPAISV